MMVNMRDFRFYILGVLVIVGLLFVLGQGKSYGRDLGTVYFGEKAQEKDKNQTVKMEGRFSYYDRPGRKGWWWYESIVLENKGDQKREEQRSTQDRREEQRSEDRKKEEKRETPIVSQYEGDEIKPLKEYSYEELLYMEPEKFRKIYTYYLEKAVGNPTEENMENFFNILDVARKKAALFSYMYDYILQKYAQDLPTAVLPVNYAGIRVSNELKEEEIKKYVFGKRNMYGLIVFVSKTCPYCYQQLQILERARLDGVEIKVVEVERYPEVVNKFNIERVPTILFVYRDGRHIVISSGLQTLDNIYMAIVRALKLMEGVEPERAILQDYQRGSPIDPYTPSPLWKNKK